MAEGLARALRGDAIEPYSAGTRPQGLNPLAVRAMREIGIDISGHRSKALDEVAAVPFDCVVTVCDAAGAGCPVPGGGVSVVRRAFDDPPRLARHAGSEEEAMRYYRRVRDEIRTFVETLPDGLGVAAPGGEAD
jgi:arsenate reductase